MTNFHHYAFEIMVLLFLIVTFLQSTIDKVIDWKGNVAFIKDHFSNSPLKNRVRLLLGIILLLEAIATVCMIIGVYQLLTHGINDLALIGVELSAVVLLFLLVGQRLAKDYAGAMSLAVYFLICLAGIFSLSKNLV